MMKHKIMCCNRMRSSNTRELRPSDTDTDNRYHHSVGASNGKLLCSTLHGVNKARSWQLVLL